MLVLYVSVVMVIMRALDIAILVFFPRSLFAYLRTWKSAFVRSPFSEHTFATLHIARASDKSVVEFTYGETPVVSARSVLRAAGVGEKSVVFDLGAGRGRVLIAAHTLGAAAFGCDLLPAHVELTKSALATLDITLAVADATQVALGGATHIFITWTCFTAASRAAMTAHLASASARTIVLVLDAPMESPHYRALWQRKIWCSWGRATVFAYERVDE